MKVSVAVHLDRARAEIEYTLRTLLEVAGLPFEFMTSPTAVGQPGTVLLHYGLPAEHPRGGVTIPADDPDLWLTTEPASLELDGIPILYVGDAPSSVYHQQGDAIRLEFDLARAAFWLLSRQEEMASSDRDAFGRFACSASWLMRQGLAEVPVVDHYAALLSQVLAIAARDQEVPLLHKLRWPQGQSYAVVLSHDVDDAGRFSPRQGLRLLTKATAQGSPRAIARGAYFAAAGLGRSLTRQSDPYWNFGALMDLEARAGFRSTFFFVPQTRSVDRDPPYEIDTPHLRRLLSQLDRGGWEVGVHGSFDSHLDAEILRAQRLKLEQIVGAPVRGVRQHYLRLQVPETFRAQTEAGYTYDSTLGYRGAVGFRAGAAFPFRPFDTAANRPLSLLELPLTIMDGPLFWQLELSPDAATERTLALLQTACSVRGLAVLLWHQRVWYEKKYPGWGRVYRQAVEHLHQEGLAWVATAGQVADWWLAREAVRLDRIRVSGEERRWYFCAEKAVAGLALVLIGAHRGQVTVLGAEAAKRVTGEGKVRLDLGPLTDRQTFQIVLTQGGSAP